jgi:hypothetical protein
VIQRIICHFIRPGDATRGNTCHPDFRFQVDHFHVAGTVTDPKFSGGFRVVGHVVVRIGDSDNAVSAARGMEYRYLTCLVSMTSTLVVPRSAR